MHVDKVMMGVVAVRQLRDRAEDLNRPAMMISLSTQLIVRETVAKIATS
jgi:DNA-binding LacI/PurR family transcriptional regulator